MIPGWDRTFGMPGPLKLLHGAQSAPRDLFWVYAGALGFTLGFLIAFRDEAASLDALRLVVLVLAALDLAGGAIANLSPGTRDYWRSRPARLRMTFLAVHGVHAAAVAFVFPGSGPSALLAWAWMMGAGLLLTLASDPPRGAAPAMALALAGATAIHLVPGLSPAPGLLLAVFMVKLVFAFCAGVPGSTPHSGDHPG